MLRRTHVKISKLLQDCCLNNATSYTRQNLTSCYRIVARTMLRRTHVKISQAVTGLLPEQCYVVHTSKSQELLQDCCRNDATLYTRQNCVANIYVHIARLFFWHSLNSEECPTSYPRDLCSELGKRVEKRSFVRG